MPKNKNKNPNISVNNNNNQNPLLDEEDPFYLPPFYKPNGNEMGPQYDRLCTAYAFRASLLIHELDPKYFPNKNYPKNFLLGFETFKKVRDLSRRKLSDKESIAFFDALIIDGLISWNPGTELNTIEQLKTSDENLKKNLLEFYEKKIAEVDWDEVDEYIYQKQWEKTEFNDKTDNDYTAYATEDMYAYLFGFQVLPEQESELSLQEVKRLLLTYGPLVITGELGINEEFTYLSGYVDDVDSDNSYPIKSVTSDEFDGGHAVTILGVDTSTNKIYYLDPNFPQTILQIDFQELKKYANTNKLFYRPCGKDSVYLENIVFSEDYKQDQCCPNTVCSHLINNLNIKKEFKQSPDDIKKQLVETKGADEFFSIIKNSGYSFFGVDTIATPTTENESAQKEESPQKKQKR